MVSSAQLDRMEAERDEAIRIQLYPRETECAICDVWLIEGHDDISKGIAMFEGEPVPHDWTGDWGGFPCCRRCFDEFERVQSDERERRIWFATKRRQVRLDHQDDWPGYAGDI